MGYPEAPDKLPKYQATRDEDGEPAWSFDMDGSLHEAPNEKTGCCRIEAPCACGGALHYQPVYGGYYHQCERCGTTSL
jgi:hypothetical protein